MFEEFTAGLAEAWKSVYEPAPLSFVVGKAAVYSAIFLGRMVAEARFNEGSAFSQSSYGSKISLAPF